jgi:hypothetical protein
MLDDLRIIAALLNVFALSFLALASGVVAYALLKVFLQGLIGQRESRNGSGGASRRCANQ